MRDNCKGRVWSMAARHNAMARNRDAQIRNRLSYEKGF